MASLVQLFSWSPVERLEGQQSLYNSFKKAGKWLLIAESVALFATLFINGMVVPPLVLSFTGVLAITDAVTFGLSLLVENDRREKVVRFAASFFSCMMVAGAVCGTVGLFSANLPLFLAGIGLFAVGFGGRVISQCLSR